MMCGCTTRASTGPSGSAGGDVTIVQRYGNDSIPDYLLPEEFGGTRIVNWGITA